MPPPDGPRPEVVGPESGPAPPFPLRLNGKVIKGFGRGSSELGIPTANIPISGLSVGGHEDVESGVYYGWAGLSASKATSSPASEYTLMSPDVFSSLQKSLPTSGGKEGGEEGEGKVYPMVMSIGWNPFYKNSVRSVEVHLMHGLSHQFYESHMNLVVLGFIRPEYDYVSKESLVEDIRTDIDVAGRSLCREKYREYAGEGYLREFGGRSEVGS
ncbi:riboflavin kinase [Saxophila tyrrhenica]|uniref:Riboflavin kinase n=1 Tax=Saxophila tyrrhenica TaxID=1690608 RepID=A0AAV9NYF9_9PEZI|nr:riboflavin kinase [Saxophila tyrrhenica]